MIFISNLSVSFYISSLKNAKDASIRSGQHGNGAPKVLFKFPLYLKYRKLSIKPPGGYFFREKKGVFRGFIIEGGGLEGNFIL